MTIKKKETTRYASITSERKQNDSQSIGRKIKQSFDKLRSSFKRPRGCDEGCERPSATEELGSDINSGSSFSSNTGSSRRVKNTMILEKAAALSIIFLTVLVFYYRLYPFNVVTLTVDPIPVSSPQVKTGEPITLFISFDKHMNVKPRIKYYLVDGFVSELSKESIVRPLGDQKVARTFIIPPTATKGMRKIRIELEYQVNPIRVIPYSWDSEWFEVI